MFDKLINKDSTTKPEMENVEKEKQEYKLIGKYLRRKGLNLYAYNQAKDELAWTSFDKGVKKFEYLWAGFKKKKPIKRIHPTQKPIDLYKWLLRNYAQPHFKILSTHVGSASDLIAFEDFGCEYVGYELDCDYFEAAKKRLDNHKSQLRIF